MGMPGGFELVAIIIVVLLLFGGKKIPELAKGVGKGIKDFKNAMKEDENKDVAKVEPQEAKKEEETQKTASKVEPQKTQNA